MIMYDKSSYTISCDDCGALLDNWHLNLNDAISDARHSGWKFKNEFHYCDECSYVGDYE